MFDMYPFSSDNIEAAVASLKNYLVEEARASKTDMLPLYADIKPELSSFPDIKAVFFDIYGTLIISAAGEVGSAKEIAKEKREMQQEESDGDPQLFSSVLERLGFSVESTAGYRAEELYLEGIKKSHMELRQKNIVYPEVNIIEIWYRLLAILVDEGLIREESVPGRFGSNSFNKLKISIQAAFFYEISVNTASPMPNAEEMIKLLSTNNFFLGIISNAQFYTPLLLEALFGKSPDKLGFDEELCNWSWRLREAKPSQELFKSPLEKLSSHRGISPKEVLYIGNDMRNDILPAKEAGCKAVLFAGDKRSLRLREDDETLRSIRPDGVITDLAQLREIIPGLQV
ncbi:MAG: HAD family hydrolase [Spirochaetia bacterium]